MWAAILSGPTACSSADSLTSTSLESSLSSSSESSDGFSTSSSTLFDTSTAEDPTTTQEGETVDSGCGDGVLAQGEHCDDGNALDDDGCDADCGASMAIDVAAGTEHTCIVARSGNVYCWGANIHGALGLGHTMDLGFKEVPASIPRVETGIAAKRVVAGGNQTCVLLVDETIRCWGENYEGVLGLPGVEDIGDDELPVDMPPVDVGGAVTQISLSLVGHACVLLNTGEIRCWGRNGDGQLGLGNIDNIGDDEPPASVGPVDVGGPSIQVSAQGRRSCALLASGGVLCWGYPAGGSGHGNLDIIGDDETPASAGDIPLGRPATQVQVGGNHVCALLDDSSVRCFGWAISGALGQGNTDDIGDDESPDSIPPVPLPDPVRLLAVGAQHTCVVLSTQELYCWGGNDHAQLGHANLLDIGDDEPASAAGPVDIGKPLSTMSLGAFHTCGITKEGTLRCWGDGSFGKLGYGNQETIGDDETPASAGDVMLF